MKISKTAVLTAGSALMMAGLGLMFVSAADKTLFVDPNNAVQHFETVRIVPIESGDDSMADIVKQGSMFGIKTDYNFIISKTGDVSNKINKGVRGSSILGGIKNIIQGGKYNGILGGENNRIITGDNNAILGGSGNNVEGNYSVILGGENNNGTTGSYSAIVGGKSNKIGGSYAVALGENNNVQGYNGVGMGSGAKIHSKANHSFLWTDGDKGKLGTDHVFSVMGDRGMVINATGAHNLAQLTISGSLVVYDDGKAPLCSDETKGVLKVITGNSNNIFYECFCSCDGSGRNSLHEGAICETLCSDKVEEIGEVCGGVIRDCSEPYFYTGNATSGACAYGELVNGTGAFFVSTERIGDVFNNYINRSCQLSSGEVIPCNDKLEGEGCPNHYKCEGELETGAVENNPGLPPTSYGVRYFYAPDSGAACAYHCTGDYYYDLTEEKCVLCPEGQVYVDGQCKTVCNMSKINYQNITLRDEDGYAITLADRNVGATSSDISKPESLGCYFQWGNSYGFQPLGNIKTGDRVDASGYGPSTYSSDRYVVMSEFHAAPYYGDWSLTPNNNLWGGGGDNFANAFGIKVTKVNKEQRRGPCPEGYHVPSIGEWSDLFTIWYKNKHGSADWAYVKDGGKIVASKNKEDVEGFTNEIKLAPLGERDNWGNAVFIPQNKGGSYWASSSPWIANSLMVGSNVMEPEDNNANSFDFSIDNTWGGHDSTSYLGHGNRGVKGSGQGVRCFKDEPICPEGKRWNQTDLKCEEYDDTEVVDLEVFMVSSTGSISHYVMMDRNLGATEVYKQNSSYPNNASYGKYYQWGNNHGFPNEGDVTSFVEQVDASKYGPDNYYSRSLFHENSEWDTSYNGNLWGDVTNTLQARQGPCPDEYHIPSSGEWSRIYNNWNDASTLTNNVGVQWASDFLMPFAGIRTFNYGVHSQGEKGHYRSSTPMQYPVASSYEMSINQMDIRPPMYDVGYRAYGLSVRCFKNSINYQKLTVYPNGGTGAVISIDWETSSRGKIVALGEPTKAGYTFGGWYTNSSFTNRVYKGNTISEGSHLYAKWVNDTPETIKITCNLSDPAVVEWCDNDAIPSAKLNNIKYQISVGNKDIPIDVYTKIDYIAWYNGNYEVIDNNSGRLKHVTNVSGYQNNRDGFSPSSTTCNTNGHSNVYITKYASLSPDSEVTEKTITNDGKTYNISLECNVPQLGTIVNECTVTYDLGDGEGKGGKLVGRSSNTEIVNCGEKVTLPNATWDRHEFWGWYDSSRVGGAGDKYTVWRDVTLRAAWSQEMHICKNSTNNPLFQEGITAQVNGAGDEDGEMTLYPDEQAAQGKSCAYVCTGDYVYLYPDGDKQARCAKCTQGSERKNERGELIGCAETIDACPQGYRYDPTASENPCFLPGSCLKHGRESNKKPDNAIGNFEDMQSDSAQYYDWKCRFKEQDVELHRCQFSCEEGYVCNSSSDGYGDSCVLPYCYRHTYMNGDKNAIQASSEKPSEFHGYWKFMTGVSNVEEFNAKISKLNGNYGCYYWCDDDHLYTGGGYYQCFDDGQPPVEESKTCKGNKSYLWGNDGTNGTPTPGHDTRQTFWSLTGYEHASEGCTTYCKEGTEGLYLERQVSIQPGSDDYKICWKQCSNKDRYFYKGYEGCRPCGYGQRANPDESTWLPYNDSRGNPVDCVNICRDDETYSNDSDVCNGKSECCKLTNVSGRSCDELEGGPYIEVPLPGGGYDCIRDPEEVGG